MTTQCVVRAALTEERSKAEISLGFAVSRRDQVLLPPKAAVGTMFSLLTTITSIDLFSKLCYNNAKRGGRS
jgi:hypothetical protein